MKWVNTFFLLQSLMFSVKRLVYGIFLLWSSKFHNHIIMLGSKVVSSLFSVHSYLFLFSLKKFRFVHTQYLGLCNIYLHLSLGVFFL